MTNPWFRSLRRIPLSSLRNLSSSNPFTSSHGSVHLVISEGKPKFETRETEPPTKEKWKTKKRFKQQRKRDKDKRKSANKKDPRFIGVKGKKKKQKFANAADRINDKLEKSAFCSFPRISASYSGKSQGSHAYERLKRYEVPKAQGPVVEPHDLTGEERFYFKKMAQKGLTMHQLGEEESLVVLFLICTCIGRNTRLLRLSASLVNLVKYKSIQTKLPEAEVDSTDEETSETEDDFEDEDPSVSEIDVDDDNLSGKDSESCDGGEESSIKMLRTPSSFRSEMGC
ncbi:hypothetical protein C3L33_15278, partial [Rhododendron williamsianum]